MTHIIEIPTADDTNIAVPNIEFNGQKVMTTELLAQLFDCTTQNIRTNFSNHKSQFELNFDYFELAGSDLKDFKNQVLNKGLSNLLTNLKYTPQIVLWTKYGATLLSKIINTPQAWAMQKRLIQFYFEAQEIQKQKEEPQPKQQYQSYHHANYQHSPVVLPIHSALAVADFLIYHLRYSESSIVAMTTRICEEHNIATGFLPEYIEQNPVSSLSKLLEEFNLTHRWTAHKLNLILEEHGILEKITRKSTKSEDKLKSFWSLTSKGLEWGKNEVYPPNPRETQPLYFRDKFMSLLKQLQII